MFILLDRPAQAFQQVSLPTLQLQRREAHYLPVGEPGKVKPARVLVPKARRRLQLVTLAVTFSREPI